MCKNAVTLILLVGLIPPDVPKLRRGAESSRNLTYVLLNATSAINKIPKFVVTHQEIEQFTGHF